MKDVKEKQQSQSHGEDDENEIVTEDTAFVHGEPPQDATGPPKVDSDVEILHEKVTKQIIKEGHGHKASKYSTCFCLESSSAALSSAKQGQELGH
ncbi:hypothetical protein REPUB_Repub17cG0192300 [Reevesia pubescens]